MATIASPDADGIESVVKAASIPPPRPKIKEAANDLAGHILLYSFVAAVVLAFTGFVVVAVYLFQYLNDSVRSFDANSMTQLSSMDLNKLEPILIARAGLWKFILQSCGIISGVAFGFLGFGLFLLGAKGDMDASFNDRLHKVQFTRMAPGGFVILIAAVLIGICSTTRVELTFRDTKTPVNAQVPADSNAAPQSDNQGDGPPPTSMISPTSHSQSGAAAVKPSPNAAKPR